MTAKKQSRMKISESEWKVLEVCLDHEGVTALGVEKRLSDEHWNIQTIKTLLRRLVDKGALKIEKEGNRFLYFPARPRDAFIAEEGKSFVERVFGGVASSMLLHFVEKENLNKADIDQLKELLDAKEKALNSKKK